MCHCASVNNNPLQWVETEMFFVWYLSLTFYAYSLVQFKILIGRFSTNVFCHNLALVNRFTNFNLFLFPANPTNCLWHALFITKTKLPCTVFETVLNQSCLRLCLYVSSTETSTKLLVNPIQIITLPQLHLLNRSTLTVLSRRMFERGTEPETKKI